MTPVFADTSFYQALLNSQDAWHIPAKRCFADLEESVVTTEYVLLELGALMSRSSTRAGFVAFVERTRRDPSVEVLPASEELFNDGLALFAARLDKEWSLTDCLSFVVMEKRGISSALTSDQHFIQAGYHALMRE